MLILLDADKSPARGDRIVAIGAVRLVNGRLLRQERFEQLVDPGREVSPASTAVHGLTRAMLTGQPDVESVLPTLARFAEDTVLVGHNVGFDLQFLRVLEEGSFRRLGGKNEIRVDVRVVAATNKDPVAALKEGQFREDLYYRLNVFNLSIPPLRQRVEDIPLIVTGFIEEFNGKYDKHITGVDDAKASTRRRTRPRHARA